MLKIKNLSFRHKSAESACLKNISLQINKGEFILLTGTSGSGKSSLTSCLNGLIPNLYEGDLDGVVELNTKALNEFKSYELSEHFGSVFQDPRSQFFATDVLSELAFSCENLGLAKDEILQRIKKVSEDLNIKKLWGKSVFQLSSGEKQKLAIASVLTLKPRILIFDEPSANLDYVSCIELGKIFAQLKAAGHTLIVAEHRLFYLKDVVDKMYYLAQGEILHEYSHNQFLQLSATDLQNLGLRQLNLNALLPKTPSQILEPAENQISPAKLEIENLTFGYKKGTTIFENISHTAKGGEITAIIGANGAGKTTLAKLLTGLLKAQTGTIKINGLAFKAKNLYKKITFIMQDADYQLFTEDLEQELFIGNEKVPNIRQKISHAIGSLNLEHLLGKHPASLSGGEKQRLTIALSMVKDSDIIILDEPTSGLDATNMQRLAVATKELAAQGKIVFIITHDYEFILQSCNKLLFINSARQLENYTFTPKNTQKLRSIFAQLQDIC